MSKRALYRTICIKIVIMKLNSIENLIEFLDRLDYDILILRIITYFLYLNCKIWYVGGFECAEFIDAGCRALKNV